MCAYISNIIVVHLFVNLFDNLLFCLSVCLFILSLFIRYITKLKKAKREGLKKAFFISCITGIFGFIYISVYALGFW